MHYVGAIDEPQSNRLSGWAVTHFGDVCTLILVVNGRDRFTTRSDGPRPDLAAKQQSRGAGGFRVDIASALNPGRNTVEVTFPDGSHVPGSPIVREVDAAFVAPPRPAPSVPPVLTLARTAPRLSPAELEDISLDDVSHAVGHGIVRIAAPPRPAEPVPAPAPEMAGPAAAPPPRTAGWLARLRRR